MLIWSALTLFISSFLVFVVQPMVGKMVLPVYGGTPSVWNTCMLFFQATLLLGYLYAHLSLKWLGIRRQILLHLSVMILPLFILPILIPTALPAFDNIAPVWSLLWTLFRYAGLPFFLVTSSAPLIQRWFSHSGHPESGDPYFLYATSNWASLLALLCYPVLLEPFFSLKLQAMGWSGIYLLLILMFTGCGFLVRRAAKISPETAVTNGPEQEPAENSGAAPGWKEKGYWLFAAFVPSSLMLGVTAHITTNVAAVPLLWILPLALYLLTFALVFGRREWIPHRLSVRLMPLLLVTLSSFVFLKIKGYEWAQLPFHLLLFFVVALVCHGQLSRSRPAAEYLTSFYLWMSLGGVTGGVFNAILSPLVFDGIYEYPVALVLSACLLPVLKPISFLKEFRYRFLLILALMAMAGWLLLQIVEHFGLADQTIGLALVYGPAAVVCLLFKDRPLRFAAALGLMLFFTGSLAMMQGGRAVLQTRNFFGVKRVLYDKGNDLFLLAHGTTVHGAEYAHPSRRKIPLAYYHPSGPVGEVFTAYQKFHDSEPVAAVGMGVGSIASYLRTGDRLVFYEIDPDVVRIAHDSRFFSFLDWSQGEIEVVIGDGRLTLAATPDNSYGMIVLDAFSSDAIPVHLLTSEAVLSYLDKLKTDGILLFHISNRFLDLASLLGNTAAELGLECFHRLDGDDLIPGKKDSHWLVMGKPSRLLRQIRETSRWEPAPVLPEKPVWTDQSSDLLRYIR